MRRLGLDRSVVVSAFRSRHGASNAVPGLVASWRVVPLATPALFLEHENVLKRPEQRSVTGMSLGEAARKAGAVATAAALFRRQAGSAQPEDLCALPGRAPDRAANPGDARPE